MTFHVLTHDLPTCIHVTPRTHVIPQNTRMASLESVHTCDLPRLCWLLGGVLGP